MSIQFAGEQVLEWIRPEAMDQDESFKRINANEKDQKVESYGAKTQFEGGWRINLMDIYNKYEGYYMGVEVIGYKVTNGLLAPQGEDICFLNDGKQDQMSNGMNNDNNHARQVSV